MSVLLQGAVLWGRGGRKRVSTLKGTSFGCFHCLIRQRSLLLAVTTKLFWKCHAQPCPIAVLIIIRTGRTDEVGVLPLPAYQLQNGLAATPQPWCTWGEAGCHLQASCALAFQILMSRMLSPSPFETRMVTRHCAHSHVHGPGALCFLLTISPQ